MGTDLFLHHRRLLRRRDHERSGHAAAGRAYTFGSETFSGRIAAFPKLGKVYAYEQGGVYAIDGFDSQLKVHGERRLTGNRRSRPERGDRVRRFGRARRRAAANRPAGGRSGPGGHVERRPGLAPDTGRRPAGHGADRLRRLDPLRPIPCRR
ncbi:MAG: hypothetical protein WDO13_08070 [Verrucomicrobiota bacterium]